MSFIIKERARLDLKQHWHWIARDNLNAADKLLRAAEGTFVSIAKNPEIGSQRSFRKLVRIRSKAIVGFEKYLVFYQQDGDTVVVLRVLHGMRNLPVFFRRRE